MPLGRPGIHVVCFANRTMEPVTREAWDALDLIEIKNRAERLQTSLRTAASTQGGAVSLADFVVEKLLGKGTNAFAYLARCRPGGKLGAHVDMLVALKVVLHHKMIGATAAMQAEIEAVFNKTVADELRGPGIPEFRSNIVHVLGHFDDDVSGLPDYATNVDSEFVDPNTSIIVLPFFSGGDLDGMIKNTAQLSEAAILNILTQVVDAIVKLQKPTETSPVGIAHRDLKPDNIFFAGSKKELALADFGEVGPLKLPFVKGTTSPGGAPDYIAPEIRAYISGMADGAKETIDYSKNDVYAIGMIGYAMCTGIVGANPWPEGIPPQALDASELKRIPAGVYSEDLRTFVEGLLSPRAAQRMTAQQAQTWTMMRIAGGAPQAFQPPAPVPIAPIVPVVAIGAEPEPEPDPDPPAPPVYVAPAPPVDAPPRWEWQDTATGRWKPFGDGLSLQIEAAHLTGLRSVDVNDEHQGCFVDPAPHRLNMKSWDNPTEVKSKIRRVEAALAPAAPAAPAAPHVAPVVFAPVLQVPVVEGFSLTQRVGAPGYTIFGAAADRANGDYTPAKLQNYAGAQAYVKGDLAIFRWAKQHWVVSDLGPDPTATGRFAQDRWLYKVPSSADTPPLAGWAAAGPAAAGPVGAAVLRACPAGHALRCMGSTHQICDVCGEGVLPGVQLWGCRTCDYDACKACYATLPGQGAPLPAHPNAAKIKQMVEHIFGDEK